MLIPMIYDSSDRYGANIRAGETITAGEWVAFSGTDLMDSDFRKVVLATNAMGRHIASAGARAIAGVAYKEMDATASDDEYSTTARVKIASGKTLTIFMGGTHRTTIFSTTGITSTTVPGTNLFLNGQKKLDITANYAGAKPIATFLKFHEAGTPDQIEFTILQGNV